MIRGKVCLRSGGYRRTAKVGGKEGGSSRTQLHDGLHPCFLSERKDVHASIVGVVHVIFNHVGGAARKPSYRAAGTRTLLGGGIRNEVIGAISIAPDMAQPQPMACFMRKSPAFVVRGLHDWKISFIR